MSADHRKPVVAFAMLVVAAAFIVGIQQAEAVNGRLLAAAVGAGTHVHGTLPSLAERVDGRDVAHADALGPVFGALHDAVGHGMSATAALETVVATPTEAAVGNGVPVAEAPGKATRRAGLRGRTVPRARPVPRTLARPRAAVTTESASLRPGRARGHRASSARGRESTRLKASPQPRRLPARAEAQSRGRRSPGEHVGKKLGKRALPSSNSRGDRRAVTAVKHSQRPSGRGRR